MISHASDAISIEESRNVWVDHCDLSNSLRLAIPKHAGMRHKDASKR
ncbi:MAG: hypothetical protein U1A77_22015 [Pirellulales bacterium]